MQMNDIRELSTHLGREKQGKDQRLEQILQLWGDWRAERISGLSHRPNTPLAIAMQMKSEQVHVNSDKPQPKQTRVVLPVLPSYFTHRRLSELDRLIKSMREDYRRALCLRYEKDLCGKEIARRMKWSVNTYYVRISEARKQVKENVRF